MTTLFTTTVSHIAGLQTQLAAATGFSEASLASLVQEALPVMVRTLGKAGTLGNAEAVRNMCQQLSAAQAHCSLAELTRPDNGWPEQRYNLAQALLGPGQLAALAQRHAPAAPAQASQLLGSLGLVVLATAGQQATKAQLSAAALQGWLHEQVAAENELPRAATGPFAVPFVLPTAVPSAVSSAPSPAAKTAPWWPLAALALVGIGASSYFWNQQSAAAAVPTGAAVAAHAPKAAPAAVAATVAPAVTVAPAAIAGARAKQAVARTRPVLRTTPVLAVPLKPTATPVLAAKPAAVKKTGTVSKIASRVPLAVAGRRPEGRKAEERGGLPHVAAKANSSKENSTSAESLLFARFDNPDIISRQPIVLERLTFSLGEASLDPEGAQQLANIANLLKAHPRCRLIVFGNAESGEPHSITLALARANAVVAELVKQGVPSAALQAQGHLSTAGGNAADPDYRRRPALYICALD